MTTRQTPDLLATRNEIVAAPTERACNDQTWELPGGIYKAMFAMFVGFIGVLSFTFRAHTAVSFGVIFAFMAAFFAIPALFPRMAPNRVKSLGWFDFLDRGIRTATGRTSALEATVLVLLLPFLILCFSVAIAIIAASL